jgi:aryl-alcohol dehydrogenase-like predicted oxidoreductase
MKTTPVALDTRRLGATDLEITTVGFGAWANGGRRWAYGWGRQDDARSIVAIHEAVRGGVNWIDTAAIYGLGHSEEVVRRALRPIPRAERPLVFTKARLVADPTRPHDEPQPTLRPASIRCEVEASLRRLGVERIDLYHLHWPDAIGTPLEESWGEMARLVEEGKVRAAGVSNFDVALLERAEAIRHVDSLQLPFSLIRRNSGADVIPWAAAQDTGVIVYPDAVGHPHRYVLGRALRDHGRRRLASALREPFLEPNVSRNLALRDALRPIAERHGATISAVAVVWTLAWPGVTGAILGARDAAQVEGWIGARSLRLTAEDLEEVSRALRRTGAGSGPVEPVRRVTV